MHQTVSEKQDWSLPLLNFRVNGQWVDVHNHAIKCARNLKSAYKDLLVALIEVEAKQIFYQVEVTSLFSYCVDILSLPKHTAYDFIDVIRTSKSIPALALAVIEGKTTVSKARRVCSVITEANQTEWINLVCENPLPVIQRCVARANPRAAVEESLEYVSGDVLEIKFAVGEDWAELLKETKDLLSTREKRAISTEEAIFILMADFTRKNCPVKKAERALARRQKRETCSRKTAPMSETSGEEDCGTKVQDGDHGLGSNRASRYRPMEIEHAVELRDQNRCTYVDRRGERCKSKRWLQKHHIVEFSKGGEHSLENLETLCSGHHRIKHELVNRH